MTSPRRIIRPVDAAEYAAVEASLARLLGTERDVILLQGEATLAIEAAARGVGGPGTRVLNIVTGPYGALLGRWLAAGGASVTDLAAPDRHAVGVAAVSEELRAAHGYDVVAIVHAEAVTGVVNPLLQIAALAREAGALIVVDAVASAGAEQLLIDDWDLDLVIVGPQKALAGPSGVSAAVVGPQAWEVMTANPAAPRQSVLSLLDWRDQWLGTGRTVLPVIPHHLETRALGEALQRLAAEGLDQTVRRHRRAREAVRAGLRQLGLDLHVADDAEAASVASIARVPDGSDPEHLLAEAAAAVRGSAQDRSRIDESDLGLIAGPAFGELSSQAIRLNHTGANAGLAPVLTTLACLGAALHAMGEPADVTGALGAAAESWAMTGA
jgi:aspartate aminotransferase-like enzyme